MTMEKHKSPVSPQERAYRTLAYIGLDEGLKITIREIDEVTTEGDPDNIFYHHQVLYYLIKLKVGSV